MVARNEMCTCNSGKKYKKCCGKPVNVAMKALSPKGVQRAFLYFVQSLCQEKEVDCLTIACKGLDSLPKDMALAIGYDPKKDAFVFKPVKVEKKPLIATPDKRIIV